MVGVKASAAVSATIAPPGQQLDSAAEAQALFAEARRRRRRIRLVGGAVILASALVTASVAAVVHRGPTRTGTKSPPRLLAGIPIRGAHTDMFLGGENLWRVGRQPRAVFGGLLTNGLSPLLPRDHGAEVDQLVPVTGGVVAHISDVSTGITYGAPGRVLFIPAANAPARVLARATMIAVAPAGQRVWVQTGFQAFRNGQGVPASFRSPTWAVSLDGRRVSPVLRLPLGLIAATESGPLTQNLATGQLQLWNGATGQPMTLNLPPSANFIAAGRDRLVWQSGAPSSALHVTDLITSSDTVVQLPRHWEPPSEMFPPPLASFDTSGRRLVLTLDRVDSSANEVAENLFVVNTAARTIRMIPSRPLPLPSSATTLGDPIAGAWDRNGLLWVLATNPYTGRYQLGFWTGAGPLHTFAPAYGSPVALSAPGSS
jgi:hypothetical protein